MDILAELKKINGFEEVPSTQLQWLIDNGDLSTIKSGEFLFKKDMSMDHMFVILSGHFIVKIEQNGQYRMVATLEASTVTGVLPYSRAKLATGFAEATEDCALLSIHKDKMRSLIVENQALTEALVHMMSSRIRDFTKKEQQNDKILALGKLSAGLAHELNNPSAAVVRSAQTLSKHLRVLPERFKNVIKIKSTDEEIDRVNGLLFDKIDNGVKHFPLMEKSQREDEIMDWLEDHNIEDADMIAENLVDFDFTEDDLEDVKETMRAEDLEPVIHWLNQVFTTEKLVSEIGEASQRINDLVLAVKGYTHMDQAPEKKPTNIHVGINNTLTILNHKLKASNVEVIKKFDDNMREPSILTGEMNQVWTNLIDNAIDAMEDIAHPTLTIDTRQSGEFIKIDITDTGSGIPQDVLDRIFEPFFTTKSIGKGTGIGLEVVHQIITQQHRGSIEVESKPGKTTFKVCFPIDG